MAELPDLPMKIVVLSDEERKLLLWCGIMLLRSAGLTPQEADEIGALIAAVRDQR